MIGARSIAYLTAWIVRESPNQRPTLEELITLLQSAGREDKEWLERVSAIQEAAQQDRSVEAFAEGLGLANGVTGYSYHTVPVVVYAWYRHFGSFRETLTAVLACGGDTDTTGAIVGALAGATVGETGIPEEWLQGIWEWPRGLGVLRAIADRLVEASCARKVVRPVGYFWPGLVLRNLFFLVLVLLHGLRRLAPPY